MKGDGSNWIFIYVQIIGLTDIYQHRTWGIYVDNQINGIFYILWENF